MLSTVLKKQQRYLLIAIWCSLIGLMIIGWNQASQVVIDVGASKQQDGFSGFNDPEKNEQFNYRWTKSDATIAIPFQHGSTLLTFNGTVNPQAEQVELLVGDNQKLQINNSSSEALAIRNYHILIPQHTNPWGHVIIGIKSLIPEERTDNRELGLLIDQLTITNNKTAWSLPPWGLLAVVLVLPLFWLYLLTKLFPGKFYLMLGISSISIISIISLWIWQAGLIEPHLVSLAIGSFVLCVFTAWMQKLYHSDWEPVKKLVFLLIAGIFILSGYSMWFYGVENWIDWWNLAVVGSLFGLIMPFISQRYSKIIAFFVIVGIIGYGIRKYIYVFERDYADDFKALYRGPSYYFQGTGLYDFAAIAANQFGNSYKYPPFFVFFMAPFTLLKFTPAIQSWRVFNLVIMLIASGVLLRGYRQQWRSWAAIGLGLIILVFQPINDSLRYGQVDMLMLLPLAIATVALLKERWQWFGAMLAIPTMLKLYPAFLLAQAVIAKRWRALIAFGLTCSAILTLSVLVLGWDVHAQFVQHVLPTTSGGTVWVENQTWNGWLNRLINPTIGLTPDSSQTVKLLTYLIAAGFSGLAWWFSRKMTLANGFGLWIITMLMVLPSTWIHYHVLLLIPIFQLLVRVQQTKQLPAWPIFGFYGLAWVCLSTGNQWTFYDRSYHGGFWALLLSYKLYGLVLLWFAVAFDATARLATPIQDSTKA
ncbi:glycosyltransferase family 87 protein [Herpetosiphon llansteffanensis]|uniref:glycosyltransferase family 87 protein n=1 Tax=Herpetosiphon llansteffanensis TaxID=2094568 RepID=UPI000F51AE41|nr:glycosyltransferase family 87 protein [Herpetosiphon llansteffanensis]